jgi:hypothetical protein
MKMIFSLARLRAIGQVAVAVVVSGMVLVGCSADQARSSSKSVESAAFTGGMPEKSAGGDSTAVNRTPELAERKIIYTGQISIQTENLDTACKELETALKGVKGYIGASSRFGAGGSQRSATYSLRVPSTSYDAFMNGLQTIGELVSTSRKADDVSEEFYDAVARVKNKKVTEKRLIYLLENKTGKLADVLTVETELSRIREEIEQIEGRIRYLSNQTSYSTIDVTITEVKNFKEMTAPTLETKVGRTFTNSLDGMRAFGENSLLIFVALVPWLTFAALLLVLAWLIRGRKAKPVTQDVAPEPTEPEDSAQK